MIIINFIGGLGNQMFQYALYRKFQLLGNVVEGDWRYCDKKDYIKLLFHIDIPQASEEQIKKLCEWDGSYKARLRRKVFGKKKTYEEEGKDTRYLPHILQMKDAYLNGYWQTEKYFVGIREDLLSRFIFPESGNIKNEEILQDMKSKESVALHIRRGDYLDSQERYDLYGEVCSLEYYKRGIEHFRQLCENPFFYVFSDDIAWARENLKGAEFVFVDWNNGKEDYYDMYLMSQCKHNIIANSSFSWWGAWLNGNEAKQVIAPQRWFNKYRAEDTVCENWIKM